MLHVTATQADLLQAVTYSKVNSHGLSHLLLFLDTSAINTKLPKAVYDMERNARSLPPTGATPSPYPLTRLPMGAYLLVMLFWFDSLKMRGYNWS